MKLQLALKVLTMKTQFIIFKPKSKKLPDGIELTLGDCRIAPSSHVSLLGVTLDQHFTFGRHFDETVKKCHGLIGVLRRSAPFLDRALLRLSYIALIRCHLEYSSSIFATASKTQLQKLDRVQRIAARVICGVSADAHSAPLLTELHLDPLETRRKNHAIRIIRNILEEGCHPALRGMFLSDEFGNAYNTQSARTALGRSRFSIWGKDLFNTSTTCEGRIGAGAVEDGPVPSASATST